MQIKINRFRAASLLACMLIGVLFFSACNEDTENDTVQLKVFGPSPALRGGELKFIGVNMDQVTAVILPENIEITDITRTSATEISIIIPQNSVPGLVVLKTPQGDITTKTLLAFTEPISIDSYAPATLKAGDKFTINGDYLNLISQVIFQSGVVVDSINFVSQTRKKIEVIVPVAAQTGKVAISNGATIPVLVYTASELQITLPAITGMAPSPVKPGADLTITGTDFQLVKSVIFTDGLAVTVFTVNTEKTAITVKVPATAKEGPVKLVAQSGVEVVSSTNLALVPPVITTVAPTTVKNGDDITVTGTNLDLIDQVVFGGDKIGTIKAGGTATQIVVTVPDDAITGVVKFTTKAAKDVAGPALTLVAPVFASFAPAAAGPKANITITGTNLDLVVDVAFADGVNGIIGTRSATQLVVAVPLGAKTGKITLIPKNGVQVQSATDITILANLPTITSFSQAKGSPGKILTINGTNMDLIKTLIFPGNIAATDYGIKTATMVEVYVPMDVPTGKAQIKMITYEGEEGLLPELFFGSTDPIVDASLVLSNVDDGRAGTWDGSYAEIGNDAALALDGKYIHCIPSAATGWHWVWGNNWYAFPAVTKADYVFKIDVMLTKPFGSIPLFQMEFGGVRVDIGSLKFSASETTEGWITVTYDLSAFGSLPATINSGGEWGINTNISGTSDISGLYMDNFRFQHK